MGFWHTQKYSNHDLVKFLESIGAQFGPCQNAYTTCDETLYDLEVPTDDETFLKQAFSVFAEFATKIRYRHLLSASKNMYKHLSSVYHYLPSFVRDQVQGRTSCSRPNLSTTSSCS